MNFDNLIKSTPTELLKEYLENLLNFSISKLNVKFHGINEIFREFRRTVIDIENIEPKTNNFLIHNHNLYSTEVCVRKLNTYNICLKISEVQGDKNNLNIKMGTEFLESVVAGLQESGKSLSKEHSSIINLQENIKKNKHEIDEMLLRIIELEKDKCFIDDQILFKTKILSKKKSITEKMKKLTRE